MKKLNVVLIGLGYWGKNHYNYYLNSDKYNLVGVCDINFSFEIKTNVKRYLDYKKINLDNVDIVSIVTPEETHYDILKYFLEKNKSNIFIEKPLVLNFREYSSLEKYKKKFDYKLLVGNLFVFDKLIHIVKNSLIGIKKIEINWLNFFIGNRKDLLIDIGTHIFSILKEIFKENFNDIKILNIIENRFGEYFIELEVNKIYIKINISNNSIFKKRELILYYSDNFIKKFDFQNGEIQEFIFANNLLKLNKEKKLDNYKNLDLELDYFYDVIIENRKNYKNSFESLVNIIKLIDNCNAKKKNSI